MLFDFEQYDPNALLRILTGTVVPWPIAIMADELGLRGRRDFGPRTCAAPAEDTCSTKTSSIGATSNAAIAPVLTHLCRAL
jgi:hypothetical protein